MSTGDNEQMSKFFLFLFVHNACAGENKLKKD